MKQQKKQVGTTLFYSYASANEQWRDQLAVHLSQFKRDGSIEELYDQQILVVEMEVHAETLETAAEPLTLCRNAIRVINGTATAEPTTEHLDGNE